MSKEKQIEEMAWDLCDIPKHPSIKSCEQCGNKHCHAMYYAERAYNAGYRKQEWISVDERLPTYKDGKVLIYTAYGISIAERTTSNRWRGDCAIPKLITHWMPLPEAPKGGAE